MPRPYSISIIGRPRCWLRGGWLYGGPVVCCIGNWRDTKTNQECIPLLAPNAYTGKAMEPQNGSPLLP